MHVTAINGSPHREGNTYHSIKTVAAELESSGISTEIIHIGDKAVRGCIACGQCAKKQDGTCALPDDGVNGAIQAMVKSDGIILASPVYYASIAGTMKSFLDRVFRVAGANGNLFRHRVGASVVAVRRAGGIPTYNQLNNYINYAEMFMPSSNYWNVAFGTVPEDMLKDAEGTQIMRVLGKNMAWLLKAVEAGKSQFPFPEREQKTMMSFIR